MRHNALIHHLSSLFHRVTATQSMRWTHTLDMYSDGIMMTHMVVILCEDPTPYRMTHVVRVTRWTPANRPQTIVNWIFEMDQSGPVDVLQWIQLEIESTIHMHRRVYLSSNQLLSFDSIFPEFDPAIQLIREYPAVRLALSVLRDHLTPANQ